MPSSFSAIIFDLDGILADSEPCWDKIDAALLAEYGVTYLGEHHREVLGINYRLAIEFYQRTFGIAASAEAMMRRRGEIATEFFAEKIDLFPSARDTLETLKEAGLKLAVGTSSVGSSARPFLQRHNIAKFFDTVVTGEEVEHGKPAPDIYLRVAEKMGVAPDRCLVVEDSLSGIASAKAAKMRVAAIPDSRFVDPRDYETKADVVLGNLSEIPPLLATKFGAF